MNKRKTLFISAAIVLLAIGGIMAVVTQRAQPSVMAEGVARASIAKYYGTAEELRNDSTLVVIGVFEDRERIVNSNTARTPGAKPPFYPGWRELSFSVTETLKGESESLVWVAQHATSTTNGLAPTEGDTLFRPGQRYVLFLTLETKLPGRFFWLTGATQGAFAIVNDKVFSRSVTGEIPEGVGPTVNGVPLEQFIRDLTK